MEGVKKTYSWDVYIVKYIRALNDVRTGRRNDRYDPSVIVNKLPKVDRILITDIDNTLTGNDASLESLKWKLSEFTENVGFGIAARRNFHETQKILNE